MENRTKLKIQQYEDALKNFEQSLSIDLNEFPDLVVDSIKSGRVQKFEICVELLWKTLKLYLWEINGIDAKSPKLVVKEVYKIGLLTVQEYEKVMEMLDDRNKLSHVYRKEQYEEIYKRVVNTLTLLKKVSVFLEPYKS